MTLCFSCSATSTELTDIDAGAQVCTSALGIHFCLETRGQPGLSLLSGLEATLALSWQSWCASANVALHAADTTAVLHGHGGNCAASALLQINMPAPVGMICVGLFLRNVAGAVLITGLKPSWSKEIRAAALAMIFLRSGLELNLSVQPLMSVILQVMRILGRLILRIPPRCAMFARLVI